MRTKCVLCGHQEGHGKVNLPGVCASCKVDAIRQLEGVQDLAKQIEQTKKAIEALLDPRTDGDVIDVTPETTVDKGK